MTKLEERLKELAKESVRHPDLRRAYMMGFKAALELPELKALIESLNFYGDRMSWLPSGETNCFQKILGADGEEMDSITNAKHWVGGNWARQALSQWRSFIGEVDKT